MKLYFSGQRSFGNRGCEALVRSTVLLARRADPAINVMVPSDDPKADSAQWLEADEEGVKIVRSYPSPLRRRLISAGTRISEQLFTPLTDAIPIAAALRSDLENSDAVFSIGGDMYSLDYGPPIRITTLDKAAIRLGKPVFLWCASVGPFNRTPAIETAMRQHLARFSAVVVREDISRRYLESLGLNNIVVAADPAFHLGMEPFSCAMLQDGDRPVVGINLSPIAESIVAGAGRDLYHETARLIGHLAEAGNNILLVPHVTPLGAANLKNDHATLSKVMGQLSGPTRSRVLLLDPSLNAQQLKWAISRCNIFIGARTHSTIAALSNHVPTLSLSYSVKAEGINTRIFGDTRYVLPLEKYSCDTVIGACERISAERAHCIAALKRNVPKEQAKSEQAMAHCLALARMRG